MDSKLKIEIDTFNTSSRNNNISNQPKVIVLSDIYDEPKSALSSFIRIYEDLQIFSSSESVYNSDNNLNDYVSTDNLKDNDILENDLKNDNNYKHQPTFVQFGRNLIINQVKYYLEFQEYSKTSETGIASIYNVSSWKLDDAKNAFGISNIQYAYSDPETIRSIQKYSFLGVPVKKTYCLCLGVKVCEFGSATLDIKHKLVNFEDQLYKNIFDTNKFLVETFTLNTYGQVYNTPYSYIDLITNIHYSGVSILRKYKQIDNILTIQKFI
ncbi:7037_t:CDS:2, partial [Dentiscutata heterogama]